VATGVSAEKVEQFITDARVLRNFIIKSKNSEERDAV
jgi:hypothetical protein